MPLLELPSSDFLGRSVSLRSGDDAFDAQALIERSAKKVIVDLKYDKGRTVRIPGNTANTTDYSIPDNASMIRLGSSTVKHDLIVESGSTLSTSLKADASLSVNYVGVSVEASSSYSYDQSMKMDSMYGLWSMDQRTYSVYLTDNDPVPLNKAFLQSVRALPPWNTGDSSVQTKYDAFFRHWGTHCIKEVYKGTRYQMMVEKQNASSKSKEMIKASIQAGYKDIVKASGSWENTEERSSYLNSMETRIIIRGGDPSAASKLMDEPKDKNLFKEWADSRKQGPTDAVISIRLEELGDLLKRSPDVSIQRLGQNLVDALSYFERKVTVYAALKTIIDRWSPGSGEYTPVGARTVISVKGPGVRVEPVSTWRCSLHEKTSTGFTANWDGNTRGLGPFGVFGINGLDRQAGSPPAGYSFPIRVLFKITGPPSHGPVQFYIMTGTGPVHLYSASPHEYNGSPADDKLDDRYADGRLSIEKQDGRAYVEGTATIPNLLSKGRYKAM